MVTVHGELGRTSPKRGNLTAIRSVKPVVTRLAVALMTLATVVVIGAFGNMQPAAACSCAGLSDAQALAGADAAFIGKVADFEGPEPEQVRSSVEPVTWTFAVEGVFKGAAKPRQEIVSAISSASCGLALNEGARYLVFANTTSSGSLEPLPGPGQLSANLCGGTRPTERDGTPAGFPPARSVEARPAERVDPPDDDAPGGSNHWRWILLTVVGSGVIIGGVAVFAVRRPPRPT